MSWWKSSRNQLFAHHWFRFLTIKSNDIIMIALPPEHSVAPFERRFHESKKCSAQRTDQLRSSPQPQWFWSVPGRGSCSWMMTAPASSACPWWRWLSLPPWVSHGTLTSVRSTVKLLPSFLPLLLLSPCWRLSCQTLRLAQLIIDPANCGPYVVV